MYLTMKEAIKYKLPVRDCYSNPEWKPSIAFRLRAEVDHWFRVVFFGHRSPKTDPMMTFTDNSRATGGPVPRCKECDGVVGSCMCKPVLSGKQDAVYTEQC